MSVHTLEEIYTPDVLTMQQHRYADAVAEFAKLYGCEPTRCFSAPGRTEVGGNHTDHNHGKVLAAGVSLDVIAMVIPADDGIIEVKSAGFPVDKVDTADLSVKKEEEGTSAALIRGVAAGFVKNGHIIGGFKAYTTSNVLKGSGLSSSAAFEVLIGNILNGLYNDHTVSAVEIAQLSQYAENVYFGKPSGLMDQMASSVGGFITIDFADPSKPAIETISFDFAASGHCLYIVDTKGSHADLTPEYAAIPQEMKAVAGYFSREVLGDITRQQIIDALPELRERFSDRALLRALHFADENVRVEEEKQALTNGDLDAFLDTVKRSGRSSYMYLQNVFAASDPADQGLSLALYLAETVLDGEGAYRVHGGGFAGTIQAFVPEGKLDAFRNAMENTFGEGSCYVLSVRPFGGTEVKLV
ncbi:MAG: galactokinase [Ruminococcus sp.]|nr:galactokinase [Ruminococcus sp.]